MDDAESYHRNAFSNFLIMQFKFEESETGQHKNLNQKIKSWVLILIILKYEIIKFLLNDTIIK